MLLLIIDLGQFGCNDKEEQLEISGKLKQVTKNQ